LGVTFDSLLFYGTGGVAFVRGNSELNSTGSRFAVRLTSVGGVGGGGVEWMYRPNLSFRLEGLHYMFEDQVTSGELTDKLRSVSVIRWGASLYFGPGGLALREGTDPQPLLARPKVPALAGTVCIWTGP
jgi:hypothetical protein